MRAKLAARLAAPDPGQSGVGQRHYLFALGQWHVGLLVCLLVQVHLARGELAGARRYARSLGHQRLATGPTGPAARPRPHCPF